MKMIVHNLVPGGSEWHQHRSTTFNASEASAMLACSPHLSRTDLLDALHTGLQRELSDFAQKRIIDPGHRFEALARALGESVVGEDLYPLVASRAWPGLSRALGASFDGLTIARNFGWEHKRLNEELKAALPYTALADISQNDAMRLPKHYRVQMEQQLMVCGGEGVLFTASEWNDAGELVDARHSWYAPDPALRAEIVAGWQQFEQDLATHVPVAHQERPEGEKQEALPVLVVQVEGRIVSSNLQVWREAALAHIKGINRDLKTDQDFADAKEAVKWCDESEKKIKLLKEQTLAQMVDVNEVVTTMDTIVAGLARTRIDLGKLVEQRETAIRNEVAQRGVDELAAHIASLNDSLDRPFMPGPTHPLIAADFQKAIKSKRTVKSLNDSVDAELARCKIAASAVRDRIQANLKHLNQACADYSALFADEKTLCLKEFDDFQAIAASRVNETKAEEERRQQRLREQEAEAQRNREAAAAERERQAAIAAAAPPPTQAPVAAPAPAVTHHTALSPDGDLVRYTATAPAAASPVVVPLRPAGPPTLKLGQICERLAPLSITADGLALLGFPVVAVDKGAKLFHEADFPLMCTAIASHVTNVRDGQQEAAA